MGRYFVMSGSLSFALSLSAIAQDSPIGKYTGSHRPRAHGVGVTLDIKSVDSGRLQGEGQLVYSGPVSGSCTGSFPLTGTFEGAQIVVRSAEKFGRAADCSFTLRGTLSGNKITGKIGQSDIELTK